MGAQGTQDYSLVNILLIDLFNLGTVPLDFGPLCSSIQLQLQLHACTELGNNHLKFNLLINMKLFQIFCRRKIFIQKLKLDTSLLSNHIVPVIFCAPVKITINQYKLTAKYFQQNEVWNQKLEWWKNYEWRTMNEIGALFSRLHVKYCSAWAEAEH